MATRCAIQEASHMKQHVFFLAFILLTRQDVFLPFYLGPIFQPNVDSVAHIFCVNDSPKLTFLFPYFAVDARYEMKSNVVVLIPNRIIRSNLLISLQNQGINYQKSTKKLKHDTAAYTVCIC